MIGGKMLATEQRLRPLTADVLASDEIEVLEKYRRAKQLKFADIEITIQEGKRVKLWLTEKMK